MFEMDLVLPENDRQAFKEPIGREMADGELDSFDAQTSFITVGDVVSLTFRKHGIRPFLSIYDGRTERREMTEFAKLVEDEPKIEVVNPAGEITVDMAAAIRGCIDGSGGLILVEGAGHGQSYLVDRPRVQAAVREFLTDYVLQEAST